MAEQLKVKVQVPVVDENGVMGAYVPKQDVKKVIIDSESDTKVKNKLEKKDIPFFIMLIILACLFIAPILLVLMNSFKGKLFLSNEPFAFPNAKSFVGFDNYIEGAGKIGFFSAFFTSLFITVFSVALIIVCTSMCAWFIVRVKKWYSQLLYLLCAFSMIVPFQMVMYPMTQVTATEFKMNLGHYLEKVHTEDIWITKNGKMIAKLVNPNVSAVDSIAGILKEQISSDTDRYSIREERLERNAIDD